jgi:exoribonuclease R
MQINTTTLRFAMNASAHASANFFQGTVPVPAFTKPVLLVGRENMNRAVQGDVVVVEVFDEREWKAPADEVIDQEGKSA